MPEQKQEEHATAEEIKSLEGVTKSEEKYGENSEKDATHLDQPVILDQPAKMEKTLKSLHLFPNHQLKEPFLNLRKQTHRIYKCQYPIRNVRMI